MNEATYMNNQNETGRKFFMLPQSLICGERYKDIPLAAKVMYSLLYDRMHLSIKNEWKDEDGKVFINYSLEAIVEVLGISRRSVLNYLQLLEDHSLITRSTPVKGRATRIYVRTIEEAEKRTAHSDTETSAKNAPVQKMHQTSAKSAPVPGQNLHPSYTKLNYTELNNNKNPSYPSYPSVGIEGMEQNGRQDYQIVLEKIKAGVDYDQLLKFYPAQKAMLDDLINVILMVMIDNSSTIFVSRTIGELPADYVKGLFERIGFEDIDTVMMNLLRNTTDVKSDGRYMKTVLFNQISTKGCVSQLSLQHRLPETAKIPESRIPSHETLKAEYLANKEQIDSEIQKKLKKIIEYRKQQKRDQGD